MKALCWHGKERRPRRHRPRPEDRGPTRRDREDHVHRHLRLRPAPLRRLHADDGDGRRPRPRADGRGRRGRQRGHEAQEGRPRGRAVHHRLRRLLVLPEGSCSRCCDTLQPQRRDRRARRWATSPAGLFGYSHMLGGFAGGQAEYLRVPYADVGPLKIESDLPDEKVLFLSDIFPTGYMAAENAEIEPGDTVAVWGCGPVGQFAIQSAWMLGAGRVIAIDRVPERLAMAREHGKAETINFDEQDVYDTLQEMTKGRGPDRCIDAVGCEAHAAGQRRRGARQGEGGGDARHRPGARPARGDHVLPQGRHASRSPASTSGSRTRSRSARAMNKGLTFKMGQTHVQRYTQAAAGEDRGRRDRPVVRHHAPRAAGGGARSCTRRSATRRTAASRSS